MSKMKASVFIQKLKDVALNYKTLYVMGCFGAPMNARNKERYTHNHEYNMRADRTKMIRAATDDTFGFDCVCLIKGVLWGWNGDKSKVYGGAGYGINGVPDIGADGMIKVCSGVSTTGWANMIPGEAVWCSGHIGVYIGDGLAVECTPAFKNKVQITAVKNIGAKSGYSSRKWTKHGRLPYIDYDIQVTGISSTGGDSDEKYIHDGLMALIGNEIGVCALMGSLYHESGLISNNMENAYENKPSKTGGVGYNDVTYTAAVDSGAYTGFINDGVGYGWAQWTYPSRKKGLLDTAKKMGKSIADKEVQMTWLKGELTTSGFTRINGNTITTGKIVTSDKQSYLDLDGNKFRIGDSTSSIDYNVSKQGRVTFRNVQLLSDSGDTSDIGVFRGTYNPGYVYYKGDEVSYTVNGETCTCRSHQKGTR